MASIFSKLTPAGRSKSPGSNRASTRSPKKWSSAKSRTSLSSFLAGLNGNAISEKGDFDVVNREIACEEAANYPLYDPDNIDHVPDCTTSTDLPEKSNLNGRPSWASSKLGQSGNSPRRSKSPSQGKIRDALYGLADTLRTKAAYFYTESRPKTPPLLQDTEPIARNSAKSTRSKKSVRFRSSNSMIQSQETGQSSPILIPQKSIPSLVGVNLSTSHCSGSVVACGIPETARPPATPMLAASDQEVQDTDSDDLCLDEIIEQPTQTLQLQSPMPGTNLPLEDSFDDGASFNAQARSSLDLKTAQQRASRHPSISSIDVIQDKALMANDRKVQESIETKAAEKSVQSSEDTGYIPDDESGINIENEAFREDLVTPSQVLHGSDPHSSATVSAEIAEMPSYEDCKDISEVRVRDKDPNSAADMKQLIPWPRPQMHNGKKTNRLQDNNLTYALSHDNSGMYDADIDNSTSEDDMKSDSMAVGVYPKAPTTSPETPTETKEATVKGAGCGAFRVFGVPTTQASSGVPGIQVTSPVSTTIPYPERDRTSPAWKEAKLDMFHPTSAITGNVNLESGCSNDLIKLNEAEQTAAALSAPSLKPNDPTCDRSDKENRLGQGLQCPSLTQLTKHYTFVSDRDVVSHTAVIAHDVILETSDSQGKLFANVESQPPPRRTAAFECSESVDGRPSVQMDETEYPWYARKIAEKSRNRRLENLSPLLLPLPETVVPPNGRAISKFSEVEQNGNELVGENIPNRDCVSVKPVIGRTSPVEMLMTDNDTTTKGGSQILLGERVAMRKKLCNQKANSCGIVGEPQSEEENRQTPPGQDSENATQTKSHADTYADSTKDLKVPEIQKKYFQSEKLSTTNVPKVSTKLGAFEESLTSKTMVSTETPTGKEFQPALGSRDAIDSDAIEGQPFTLISQNIYGGRVEHSKELVNVEPVESSTREKRVEKLCSATIDSIDLSIDDTHPPEGRSSEATFTDSTEVYGPHINSTDSETIKLQGGLNQPETSYQVVDVEIGHDLNLHRNARDGSPSGSRGGHQNRCRSRIPLMRKESGTCEEKSPDGVPSPRSSLAFPLRTEGRHCAPASFCGSLGVYGHAKTPKEKHPALTTKEFDYELRGRSSSPKGLSTDSSPNRGTSKKLSCHGGISCRCANGCAREIPCHCATIQPDPWHITLNEEKTGSGEGGKATSMKWVSPTLEQPGLHHRHPSRTRQRSRSPMVTKLLDATKGAVCSIGRGMSR